MPHWQTPTLEALMVIKQFCQLFCEWYCHQPGVSMAHITSSLLVHFDENALFDAFEIDVLLDDPLRIKAENALFDMVSAGQVKLQLPKKMVTPTPGRSTDWVETKINHMCGKPNTYIELKKLEIPDAITLGVLKTLAIQWATELEKNIHKNPSQAERWENLKSIEEKLKSVRVQPWQPGVMAKLTRLDKRRAKIIYEAKNLFHQRLPSAEKLSRRLESSLKSIANELVKVKNIDSLFEWHCSLLIAKTATQSGWRTDSFHVDENQKQKFKGIFLKKNGMTLRIAKGYPTEANGQPCTEVNTLRTKILTSHNAGENGYQPDMVLSFWLDNIPEKVITYLADAKNGGDGYFRSAIDKGIVYYLYFKQLFKENQNPACSLFFSGLNNLAYKGFDEDRNIEIHPQVIAINVINEIPPEPLGQSSLVANWFRHINSQADGLLN